MIFNFESQFTGFRMMVERSLKREPNVTCSGETNDDNNDFLGEREE